MLFPGLQNLPPPAGHDSDYFSLPTHKLEVTLLSNSTALHVRRLRVLASECTRRSRLPRCCWSPGHDRKRLSHTMPNILLAMCDAIDSVVGLVSHRRGQMTSTNTFTRFQEDRCSFCGVCQTSASYLITLCDVLLWSPLHRMQAT